jgi:hypothetical protein
MFLTPRRLPSDLFSLVLLLLFQRGFLLLAHKLLLVVQAIVLGMPALRVLLFPHVLIILFRQVFLLLPQPFNSLAQPASKKDLIVTTLTLLNVVERSMFIERGIHRLHIVRIILWIEYNIKLWFEHLVYFGGGPVRGKVVRVYFLKAIAQRALNNINIPAVAVHLLD